MGPFSLFLRPRERVAETRKTSHTKNTLLPGSLDRSALFTRSETGFLFRPLYGREREIEKGREGERDGGRGTWMEVRVPPLALSSPFFKRSPLRPSG